MKKATFTYNTLFMTGANAITRFTGFLYRIFLSRYIGAEGLGVYGLIVPIYAICCSIVASGIPTASMKLVSESTANEDKPLSKALTNAALKIVLILSLILFFILLFFFKPISMLLGDTRTIPSVIILAFAVLITGFENVYKSTFYAFNKVSVPAVTEIAEQLFRIFVVITLLIYYAKDNITLSSAVLTFGIFAGELLSFIILSYNYRKLTSKIEKKKHKQATSMVLEIAAPITISRTAETILSSVSNILIPAMLMIYGFDRSEATGSLGVISGMIMPLLYLPCIFTNALSVNIVPFVSSNLCKSNYGAVIRKMEKCLVVTTLFTLPCAILMIVYASPIAEILFDNQQVKALLPPMVIGGVAATFRHIFNSVMNACGKAKESSIYSFTANILGLFLICILIPYIGISGFVISYIVSNVFALILSIIVTSKELHLDNTVSAQILFSTLPGILLYFFSSSLFNALSRTLSPYLSFISSCGISIIFYIFIVFLFFVEKKIIFFSKKT